MPSVILSNVHHMSIHSQRPMHGPAGHSPLNTNRYSINICMACSLTHFVAHAMRMRMFVAHAMRMRIFVAHAMRKRIFVCFVHFTLFK